MLIYGLSRLGFLCDIKREQELKIPYINKKWSYAVFTYLLVCFHMVLQTHLHKLTLICLLTLYDK